MPQHCIYCGRELKRKIKGRPATTEQLLHAAAYHHPHPVTATYICDTHRLHPPTSLSSLKPKRDRTSSLDTSSSSSDSHPSSKRQRVVEILSSLSQPQQQPLTIPTSLPATDQVTATTPTSSTQSVATTTTYMSVSQEDDTSVASDATHTPLTSPLVHPYEQALAKSKQLIVTTSSETSSCSTTITVPTQQWKQFHDQLHAHVLSPNSRDKHMIHIVTSDPSNITITGRYLSVYDVKIEYVFQKPGQLISSPPGIGAAHFVYSQGILMTQLAWNYSFTIPGAIQCLSFWGIDDNHDHLADGNTSMATRTVLPLYTMQIHGYDMGLMDQIHRYRMFIQQLQSQSNRRYNIKPNSRLSSAPCPTCLYRQDWLRINNQCIHCYFRKHHQELK